LVTKEIIQLDEIGMRQESLYFDLSDQLIQSLFVFLGITIHKILFAYDFQGCNKAGLFVSISIHSYFTRKTSPNLPLPSFFIFLKS